MVRTLFFPKKVTAGRQKENPGLNLLGLGRERLVGELFQRAEAVECRPGCSACVLLSAGSGVCVDGIKHVVVIVRRVIGTGKLEGLSALQEVQVLRTVGPKFKTIGGLLDGGTRHGWKPIGGWIRVGKLLAVQRCFGSKPPDSEVCGGSEVLGESPLCCSFPNNNNPYESVPLVLSWLVPRVLQWGKGVPVWGGGGGWGGHAKVQLNMLPWYDCIVKGVAFPANQK